MKIIIGADLMDYCEASVRLLAQVRFQNAQADVVHVIEPLQVPGLGFPGGGAVDLAAYLKVQEEAGEQIVEDIAGRLGAIGIPAQKAVIHGRATHELLEYADKVNADLIAIGSSLKGSLSAFFTGSVSRGALGGARQSLLIAKGTSPEKTGLTAVLATDHSDYMDKCIDRLIAFAPQGIEKLIVLTAFTVEPELLDFFKLSVPSFAEEGTLWIEDHLHEKNRTLCEKLNWKSMEIESYVVEAEPTEAINTAMKESEADLLIMGAQGHGFIERLALGSVSFHQVVAEPHPVLVLRV
jgi:nucleotide-binding universal stress UspA family protein